MFGTPSRLCAKLACGLGLSLTVACAHPQTTSAWRAQSSDSTPLGQLGHEVLKEQDLPAATRKRLTQIEDLCAQQHFVTLWTGLEDAASERLLRAEAQRRKLTLEAFLKAEIDDKVGAPSDAEIRGFYEANKETIGVTFTEAAPFLRQQYEADRTQAMRRAVVDRLRGGQELQFLMPPPPLSRVAVTGRGPSLGPTSAKVVLVVFSDFQCGFSSQARRLIKRLTELYPQDVRVVHRHFPLAQHREAKRAAEAAQCAAEQSKFWPFYELLFENTAALTADTLRRLASTAELDVKAFNACLQSSRPQEAIARDLAEGRALGVTGTPAIFLNGMQLSGVLPLTIMRAFVDHELGIRSENHD
jgi:protein-disulfide isomerase